MKKNKTVLDHLWDVLISVRLTIAILILLILFSVLGTLIAQQGTTQTPIEQLYSASTLKLLYRFGLTDVFHSGYFVFLLLMLSLNLIACSFERLPGVWRDAFRKKTPALDFDFVCNTSEETAKENKFLIHKNPQQIAKLKWTSTNEAKLASVIALQNAFKKNDFKIVKDKDDYFEILVERGKYSRLGVYITHLSLLLIFFGGASGSIWGFESGMSIEEGTRQSWVQHLKGSQGGLPLMRENGAPVKGFLNLGFEVECESFTLETYDGERPKLFKSVLNFYENDVLVKTADIAVNHPTEYKGITFYQASYNEVGIGGVDIRVFRGGQTGTNELVKAKTGELYRVDGNAAFKVTQIEKNLLELGPAARLQFYNDRNNKKPSEFWVFKNLPGFDFAHRKNMELHFVLENVRPKYATGLSVAKDPGVWIVWIGSLILVCALFIALYTFHARYWVIYHREKGFYCVGWSNKLFLFEPRFEKFLTRFAEGIKS